MKLNIRSAVASAAVLAITGGLIATSAGMASAATTPPWEPDPNAVGSLIFWSCTNPSVASTCSVVTGGNNLNHIADYVEGSIPDPSTPPGNKATLEFAAPVPNTPTGLFGVSGASGSTTFPNANAPYTGPNPLATLGATDGELESFITGVPPQTAAGFANVFQVRLVTTSAAGGGTNPSATYYESDIVVDPTAGTWQVEFPAAVTATSTSLSANPSPATVGQATTLTASESPATAGSVAFMNGTTTIGTASVNGSGVATMSYTPTAAGTQSLSAVFTPTDTADFSGSTGNLSLTVNPAATPTTTSLTVTQDGTAGDDVSLSSTVTPAAAAGTVSWFDNGSATPLNSTPVTPNASGVATFDIPAGVAAGSHSIVAKFSPTSVTQFEASQSAPQSFIQQPKQVGACAQAGSQCTATANIEATVPTGTLVLTTPYTPSNPLNLGNLALNTGLTQYSATAPFNGISIVDTRSGDLPWTLTALASNLSDGGTHAGSLICSQNVGLTAVTSTPGSGFAGTVTSTNNPAATPAVAPSGGACSGTQGLGGTSPHTVAAASAGLGTDVLNGTLTLTAPTSTEPGLFTGTITFTVG